MGRWKGHFVEMITETNDRKQRGKDVTVVVQEVTKISRSGDLQASG